MLEVRIDTKLNKFLWSNGVRNVPRRVRVRLSRKRNEDEEAKEKPLGSDMGLYRVDWLWAKDVHPGAACAGGELQGLADGEREGRVRSSARARKGAGMSALRAQGKEPTVPQEALKPRFEAIVAKDRNHVAFKSSFRRVRGF